MRILIGLVLILLQLSTPCFGKTQKDYPEPIHNVLGDLYVGGNPHLPYDTSGHTGFMPTVNVKTDHAATGDGVTDDSTAIQNAINAVVAQGGGIVFFPPGVYIADSTLTISSKDIVLQGSGGGWSTPNLGATILDGSGNADGTILEIHTTSAGVNTEPISNVKIRNIYFKGDTDSPGSVPTSGIGISIISALQTRVEYCTFRGFKVTAIQMDTLDSTADSSDSSLGNNHTLLQFLQIFQGAPGAGYGVYYKDTYDQFWANSLSNMYNIFFVYRDVVAFRDENSDHSYHRRLFFFRAPAGTSPYSVELHGGNGAHSKSRKNTFINISGLSIKAFGTESYTNPSIDTTIIVYDVSDSPLSVAAESGATVRFTTDTGFQGFVNGSSAIEGVTSASPAVLTLTDHGLATGDTVNILNVDQDGDWATLIGRYSYAVTAVTDDTFSIVFDAGGFAAYNAGVDNGRISIHHKLSLDSLAQHRFDKGIGIGVDADTITLLNIEKTFAADENVNLIQSEVTNDSANNNFAVSHTATTRYTNAAANTNAFAAIVGGQFFSLLEDGSGEADLIMGLNAAVHTNHANAGNVKEGIGVRSFTRSLSSMDNGYPFYARDAQGGGSTTNFAQFYGEPIDNPNVGTGYFLFQSTANGGFAGSTFSVDASGNTVVGGTLDVTDDIVGSADIKGLTITSATFKSTSGTTAMTLSTGIATFPNTADIRLLKLDGSNVVSSAAELNIMDGFTGSTADLNTVVDGSDARGLHFHGTWTQIHKAANQTVVPGGGFAAIRVQFDTVAIAGDDYVLNTTTQPGRLVLGAVGTFDVGWRARIQDTGATASKYFIQLQLNGTVIAGTDGVVYVAASEMGSDSGTVIVETSNVTDYIELFVFRVTNNNYTIAGTGSNLSVKRLD